MEDILWLHKMSKIGLSDCRQAIKKTLGRLDKCIDFLLKKGPTLVDRLDDKSKLCLTKNEIYTNIIKFFQIKN